MARYRRYAFPGARRWQDMREMRSRATGSGNILARCVLGGLAVARFRRGAFPGVNPWQFFHSMHPESGLGRENRQFAARFARHASENGLALARYACHVSEKPCKSPLEDTPREDPARKGALFAARAPRIMHGARILPSFGAQEERIGPKMPTFCQKLSPKDEKMSPKVLTSF